MSEQFFSRAIAQCDYCGIKINKHNIKAHTQNQHPGKPTKERLKRQQTLATFLVENQNNNGAKKARLESTDNTDIPENTDATLANEDEL